MIILDTLDSACVNCWWCQYWSILVGLLIALVIIIFFRGGSDGK